MKRVPRPRIAWAALSFSCLLFFAARAEAQTEDIFNTTSGDWATGSLWSLSNAPNSTEFALVANGKTATIDSNDGTIPYFLIGGPAAAGTIVINSGGSLTVNSASIVGRNNSSGYTAILTMNGGALTVGTNALALNVGDATPATSPSTVSSSTLNFNGGTYLGGLMVGSTSSYQTGTVVVNGTGATISSHFSADTLTVNTYGTLDFVLNSGGNVSVLNYGMSGNIVTLGGTLDIDVSNYTGGTETVNLIDYSNLSGSFNSVAVIGTGSSHYSAAFNTIGGVADVVLTEAAIPEPKTWVLVFMGTAGLVAVVRRKSAI